MFCLHARSVPFLTTPGAPSPVSVKLSDRWRDVKVTNPPSIPSPPLGAQSSPYTSPCADSHPVQYRGGLPSRHWVLSPSASGGVGIRDIRGWDLGQLPIPHWTTSRGDSIPPGGGGRDL